MKFKLTHIDKIALPLVILLLIGIVSSYINLGAISVIASVALPVLFVLNIPVVFYAIRKRKYIYVVGVVAFLFCNNFFFQISSEDIEDKNTISLLSYNVRAFADENSKTASEIIKFIDSINPDILLLQESAYKVGRNIKGFDYHFLGYRKEVEKTLLDIYSKFPIINKGHIDFPETRNNSIYADIKIQEDTIRVYNLHLQSFAFTSNSSSELSEKLSTTINKQIKQAELVKLHAKKSNISNVISGDFNATQFSVPYRVLSKELNDSFTKKGKGLGTTYSVSGFPIRLDYALLDKSLKITNHKNFDLNLSDHEPILIKFKTPKMLKS